MSPTTVSIGKYVVRHQDGSNLSASNNGHEWRDLRVDDFLSDMIFAMLREIEALRARVPASVAAAGTIMSTDISSLGYAWRHAWIPGAQQAVKTLKRLGYAWAGGDEWQPPTGQAPVFVTDPPQSVLWAIGKMLNEANGANSVSMPDEYVAVSAWLCGLPEAPLGKSDAALSGCAKIIAEPRGYGLQINGVDCGWYAQSEEAETWAGKINRACRRLWCPADVVAKGTGDTEEPFVGAIVDVRIGQEVHRRARILQWNSAWAVFDVGDGRTIKIAHAILGPMIVLERT